ncbi:MAG: hypothetical protein U1F43_20540 [Myxococcota bacterium]
MLRSAFPPAFLLALGLTLGLMFGLAPTGLMTDSAHAGSFADKQRQYERVRDAFAHHLPGMKALFDDAGAAWPPRGVYLRGFKLEGELELWAEKASGHERVRVRVFPICATSGELGPKSQAGDGQVPEGFYTIDRFNPRSAYHLSLGLDYPNKVDLARGDGASPGGDIFIHGNCVTIGCIPIQDDPVEALYVVAVLARDGGQSHIPVHVFPFHFGTAKAEPHMKAAAPDLLSFWSVLQAGYQAFETTHIPPRVDATRKGYVFKK